MRGLTLIDDDDALRCEIVLADTHFGRLVVDELAAGLLRGLCPEYTVPNRGDWYEPLNLPSYPGMQLRHVTAAELWAISFVDQPGYPRSGIDSWTGYHAAVAEWPSYHDRIYGLKVQGTILK